MISKKIKNLNLIYINYYISKGIKDLLLKKKNTVLRLMISLPGLILDTHISLMLNISIYIYIYIQIFIFIYLYACIC